MTKLPFKPLGGAINEPLCARRIHAPFHQKFHIHMHVFFCTGQILSSIEPVSAQQLRMPYNKTVMSRKVSIEELFNWVAHGEKTFDIVKTKLPHEKMHGQNAVLPCAKASISLHLHQFPERKCFMRTTESSDVDRSAV